MEWSVCEGMKVWRCGGAEMQWCSGVRTGPAQLVAKTLAEGLT